MSLLSQYSNGTSFDEFYFKYVIYMNAHGLNLHLPYSQYHLQLSGCLKGILSPRENFSIWKFSRVDRIPYMGCCTKLVVKFATFFLMFAVTKCEVSDEISICYQGYTWILISTRGRDSEQLYPCYSYCTRLWRNVDRHADISKETY